MRCRNGLRLRGVGLLLALGIALASPSVRAETVKVGSTGAALGVLDLLAVAFREDQGAHTVHVVRPSVGSTGAILGVIRGDFGLGVSSRPLKDGEKSQGVKAEELGRSPFVLATARDGATGLTLAQVTDFYSGKQTRWPDGGRLRLVLRPSTDSDTDQLKAMSPAMKEAVDSAYDRPGMAIAPTDQDAADLIARIPGAIGPTTLAVIRSENRPLRALALDGIAPSLRALEEGQYPHFKTFDLILPVHLGPAAQAFVDFLKSPRGRQVLRDSGFSAILKE